MICVFMHLIACYLSDPEKLLPRAAESLKESNQFLTSYQNSIRFGPEHNRLVQIMIKLEKLEEELTEMSEA